MTSHTTTDRLTTLSVVTLETPSLGDRSYLIHDGAHALVVDPQRDVQRVLDVLTEHGLELVAVAETHVHNDYVTGGLELARRTGASYLVAADEDVSFDRTPVRDGDVVEVGTLRVRAVHTPGHTPTHLSYVVGTEHRDEVVCTGGGLLFGSVGRTDLISAEMTEPLTRDQHRSAHRLAELLDDEVDVLPTHGFGSFCSSGETTGRSESTIGMEREDNQALRVTDEDVFVTELLAGLDAFPAYYAHMAPANRRGPDAIDLAPPEVVDRTELARRIHAGEWVVDLRARRAFAERHLLGTINVELGDSFVTYLGWILPWETPVTLIGEREQDVAAAQLQLARIGVDRPAGQAATGEALASDDPAYRVASFAELQDAITADEGPVVLDTRRDLERAEDAVPGSLHVPLHELLDRLDELPDAQLWVHCASGYRASIAASLLHRAGHDVVLVDDDFSSAPTGRS